MQIERKIPFVDLEALAERLTNHFIQRHDLYPKQLADGSYVCVHEPLGKDQIIAHLRGKTTLGAYLLDADSLARFVVFDADSDEAFDSIIRTSKGLSLHGIPSYLEISRRGGHLWLFFDQPVPGNEVRLFARGIAATYGLDGIEIYPKQDRLTTGPGSLVRLPFGIHRKTGERYGFVTTNITPLASSIYAQIHLITEPHTVSETASTLFQTYALKEKKECLKRKIKVCEGALSERIKATISVYDFVGEYVTLTASGRGLCPFHDDHHASFSVNVDENYWHCFAGCGGGSIIDFWMKWQGSEFKQAVSELAGMLLD